MIKLLQDTVNFAWKPSWQPIFSNGTVNKPADNYWTGIVYGKEFAPVPTSARVVVLMVMTADYYFVESGNKLLEMGLTDCRQ